ncbi:hypothetical protein [Bacillus horti]|uniref:Uncharacterized protein n=1 Tax=Caldalkalibacillus horti TaxID=77523 RepID=A0ABT9VWA6_9BACI|nr:hypothetical protein [Bacillus horti]MDQ0165254.1 hypothetical protein [Bacillus horti]
MEPLATQIYYKVQREVDGLSQRNVEYERTIYLYEDRVVTQYREFPFYDVYDVSYRRMGKEKGLLYLHTRNGIYSYTVKTDPDKFIKVYKKYKRESQTLRDGKGE